MEIKAGNKDKSQVITVNYDMPETYEAACEAWGADAVFNLAIRQASTDIQNLARVSAHPDKEGKTKTEAEIQELVNNYVPGTRRAGVPRKKAIEGFTKEQLLARLQEMGVSL